MQPHDPQGPLNDQRPAAPIDPAEARKLHFEARKFAIETLVKMNLAQLEATRNMRVGHVKMTFALSLGALASFLTLVSAFARFTDDYPEWPEDRVGILLLVFSLGLLLAAAIAAISQYKAAVDRAADQLFRPYPSAETEFADLLSGRPQDEIALLDRLSTILKTRTEDPRQHQPASSLVLMLALVGIIAGGVSLAVL